MLKRSTTLLSLLSLPVLLRAQTTQGAENWLSSPGIIGTLVLSVVVLSVFSAILIARLTKLIRSILDKRENEKARQLKEKLINLDDDDIDSLVIQRQKALKFKLSRTELGGDVDVMDEKGLVNKITSDPENPFFWEKKKNLIFHQTDNQLIQLILAFLGASAFWLILGTLVGEYLGMKFVWPDLDHVEWLSFGRLRPVHTNTVFWGWASLAMIGLGYFVVSRTSNVRIFSIRWGWISWWLINISVFLGDLFLMNGVNNGGGEYREFIWPVMALFAAGLLFTLINFYKTISARKTKDIYISNWYILASLTWTITLVVIGYLPWYQHGLGETVIQGYYMHQGVGMWFMTFTLGLIYYYLPSSLNKPIYSYALGVLALWTQMLFYTMIGTHHFVFSPLPWWLQTIAIVFSGGMFIPVLTGTTNFLMTMRGSWKAISDSYVLPFMLVGVIFYFVGSSQGSFQAFRFTNAVWHFTDFNVAHSHMTMYGIISFFLWGSIYAITPRLCRTEPRQVLVGMHFWFAFMGLMLYMFSMMIGGTEKGLSWINGQPFIESVKLMMPYWVWRAVGGTLMFLSHLVFGYNMYVMTHGYLRTRSVALSKKEVVTA